MSIAERISPVDSLLDEALDEARNRYVRNHPESAASFKKSIEYMPGGNTRTVLFHEPFPLRVVSASGCRITDADGVSYVNMLGEYTAGLFGHNDPQIRAAIDSALDSGISLSGHNPNEIELSRLVCERFPSLQKVRFTNSGTEANLMAIATARYVTGRNKVMVFNGGYHGGLLYFGNGGMPLNAPYEYVVADYNVADGLEALFSEHGDDLACVLVEPVQGSAGCIPGNQEFLQSLRDLTRKSGALLVFDEVMTSRLSSGGSQAMLGIIPDMTTLGKYIGGGMTFGAFGGSEEVMNIFDPRLPNAIPHAGTFNNNALTMAAGTMAMGSVLTDEKLNELNARGEALRERLNGYAHRQNFPLQFTGVGSILGMHGTNQAINNIDDLAGADGRIKELVFLDLIEAGFYIARRGFISLMLTLGDAELEGFGEAMERILAARHDLVN